MKKKKKDVVLISKYVVVCVALCLWMRLKCSLIKNITVYFVFDEIEVYAVRL